MHKGLIVRIVYSIILFASVLFYPWWITLFFGVVGVFLFNRFYEVIVVGVLIDMLHGAPVRMFFDIPFVFTLGSLLLLWLNVYSKKFFRAV